MRMISFIIIYLYIYADDYHDYNVYILQLIDYRIYLSIQPLMIMIIITIMVMIISIIIIIIKIRSN